MFTTKTPERFDRKKKRNLLILNLSCATLLAVLIPTFFCILLDTYVDYRAYITPSNWTSIKAEALSSKLVWQRRRISQNGQCRMEVKFRDGNGPVQNESYGPMSQNYAKALQRQIVDSAEVDVYKSKDPKFGYALSYIYGGDSKFQPLLFFGSIFSVLVIGAIVAFWRARRKNLLLAAAMRPRLYNQAQQRVKANNLS
jgi:hypothetical protein